VAAFSPTQNLAGVFADILDLSNTNGSSQSWTYIDVMHRRTSTLVSCFILLRDLLAALPALAAALQPAQATLLCTMRSTFENGAFADMLAAVNEVIDEVRCVSVDCPAVSCCCAFLQLLHASIVQTRSLLLLLSPAIGVGPHAAGCPGVQSGVRQQDAAVLRGPGPGAETNSAQGGQLLNTSSFLMLQ
jgi:hypothetical protein